MGRWYGRYEYARVNMSLWLFYDGGFNEELTNGRRVAPTVFQCRLWMILSGALLSYLRRLSAVGEKRTCFPSTSQHKKVLPFLSGAG